MINELRAAAWAVALGAASLLLTPSAAANATTTITVHARTAQSANVWLTFHGGDYHRVDGMRVIETNLGIDGAKQLMVIRCRVENLVDPVTSFSIREAMRGEDGYYYNTGIYRTIEVTGSVGVLEFESFPAPAGDYLYAIRRDDKMAPFGFADCKVEIG